MINQQVLKDDTKYAQCANCLSKSKDIFVIRLGPGPNQVNLSLCYLCVSLIHHKVTKIVGKA